MNTKPASSSRPTSGIQSQFHGDNFVITGGQFNQYLDPLRKERKSAFEQLQEEVAPTAFHNSAQRLDPPKCHPNTRQAVIKKILDWVTTRKDRETWVMWLNGAAGAGKSAIAQSVAEICVKQGIPIASFFFFRTDSTRNSIRPLVATLAYQLARTIPEARGRIIQAIENDPLVFRQSLQYQLETLIVAPLHWTLSLPPSEISSCVSPLVLLIDGLDECDDRDVQTNLIRTLSDISANTNIPLLFLIASRQEPHLTMAFNSKNVNSILMCLPLDNRYLPDDDIRCFLYDKFAEIKDTHPYKDLLDSAWPNPPLIDEIVTKSSGQFIYAAVVMNYVSSASTHPAHRLEVCRGLRAAASDTPFAQLDILYQHIFSEVKDIHGAQRVLAMAVHGVSDIVSINGYLDLAKGSVEISLSDLTSIVVCSDGEIKFLHASLPDFLCDPVRSEKYYIDPGKWCTQFAASWLRFGRDRLSDSTVVLREGSGFLEHACPSTELHHAVLNFEIPYHRMTTLDMNLLTDILSKIKSLDFEDEGTAYNRQVSLVSRYVISEFGFFGHFPWEKLRRSQPQASDKSDVNSRRAKVVRWFCSTLTRSRKGER